MFPVRNVPAVLLLLATGLALPARAATDAPLLTPPPLVSAIEDPPATPTHREDNTSPSAGLEGIRATPPASTGRRVFSEVLGGGLGGGAGLLVGVLTSLVLEPSLRRCNGDVCTTDKTPMVGLSLLGLSLGTATGVYVAGHWMDGRGSAVPTYAGALIGGATSTALYIAGVGKQDADAGRVTMLLSLPLAAAIASFEWSSARAPHVMPSVTLGPDGGAVGLSGSF
ncbi:hypothetical protein JGU66_02175 [Myxococcaceae bacterium JPH2]|nr:hypothetical protein [Myxococcaceae bacterium JPH2]